MILSPCVFGKGLIPFGDAKLCHVIYGYIRLDFDVEEFRQHLGTVLQMDDVDMKYLYVTRRTYRDDIEIPTTEI